VKLKLCLQYGIGGEGFVPRSVRPYSVFNDRQKVCWIFGLDGYQPDFDGQNIAYDVLARQYLFLCTDFTFTCPIFRGIP
jgi:hypothetical protein